MQILCVCTGNTCRSPMLMCLLQEELKRAQLSHISVVSAGTAAASGDSASSHARTCMQDLGLSLDAHRSQRVDPTNLAQYQHILCMTSNHAAALRSYGASTQQLEVVNAAKHGVPDPFGGELSDYKACAQVLQSYARDLVARLKG